LNRGIQGQNVGLLGDVVDQFHDRSDFLRGFAEALDALRGFLDLVANRVHALNRLAHDRGALRGDLHRALRHFGRLSRVLRYFVDRDGNFVDRRGRRCDLLRLVFGGFGEVHCRCLRFLRCGGDLHCGFIDRRDQ
jgi:hypothetical protein